MAGNNIFLNIPSNCGSTESDLPVTVVFKVDDRRIIVEGSLRSFQIPKISSVKDGTYDEGFPAGSSLIRDSCHFDIVRHSC
jgi:hypothetical protein